MPDLAYLSILEAHGLLKTKKVTATQLTEYYLDRIDKLNPKLKAVLTVCTEQALAQAKKVDDKIKAGDTIGLLEGIPYTAKDMFLTKGIRTTAASKILEDYTPPYSATVIQRLDSQGCILLAKVNQDEFAHGGSTENSAFHPTYNPWDLNTVPGGSSGGSAAAVAADFGVFSLGTDTGGSVRQPASFCGVTGLKPTYGLVSRYGVIAMASSLDVVGPVARSAKDVAIVLEAIAGRDPQDSTTVEVDNYEFTKATEKQKFNVGMLDFGVAALQDAKADLTKLTSDLHELNEKQFPTDEALSAYYIITPSEISSNLERYDGIRFGQRTKYAEDLFQTYALTRGSFFGAEVKRRNLTGTYALSAGFYDAYYKQAMKVRTQICDMFAKLFAEHDLLVVPTTLGPAFKLGSKSDPVQLYKTDILTVSVNLAGIPSVSIPVGFDSETSLPMGMQIIGKQGDDAKVLALADQFQQATSWHERVKEVRV